MDTTGTSRDRTLLCDTNTDTWETPLMVDLCTRPCEFNPKTFLVVFVRALLYNVGHPIHFEYELREREDIHWVTRWSLLTTRSCLSFLIPLKSHSCGGKPVKRETAEVAAAVFVESGRIVDCVKCWFGTQWETTVHRAFKCLWKLDTYRNLCCFLYVALTVFRAVFCHFAVFVFIGWYERKQNQLKWNTFIRVGVKRDLLVSSNIGWKTYTEIWRECLKKKIPKGP